jgi:uncharacterized membrane protein
MELFNKVMIIAHVVLGCVALLVGPLAMATRKGGRWHINWGRIYYQVMMAVMASAIILSITRRFVFFLVAVTVLSFYSTFTGVRCLKQKGKHAANVRGTWLDWFTTGAVALAGLGTIAYGLFFPGVGSTMKTLALIFGVLITWNAAEDIVRYVRPSKDPQWWLYYHISRMMGSYIAAVTAFAVNQVGPRVPPDMQLWVWIGPSLLLTPLIIGWQSYYRRAAKRRAMGGAAAA